MKKELEEILIRNTDGFQSDSRLKSDVLDAMQEAFELGKASLVKVPTKELKYITDEDAKELIKVAFPYVKNTKDIEIVQGGIMFRAKSPNGYSYLSKTIDLDDSMSLKTAVFLQSKGYKLPITLNLPTNVKVPTKELKDISDEDSIEAFNVIGVSTHLSNESKIAQFKELLSTPNFYIKQTNIPANKWLNVFAFLQSKGYKLPIILNLPTNVKVPTDEETNN